MRRLLMLLLFLMVATAWYLVEREGQPDVKVPSGPFPCTVVAVPDGDSLRCSERGPDGSQRQLPGMVFKAN